MTANERRSEIIRILLSRKQTTMVQLAKDFNVWRSTIANDIEILTSHYPIETIRGNGGGIRLADWYTPSTNSLTLSQQLALLQLLDIANEFQKSAIREILFSHGTQNFTPKFP